MTLLAGRPFGALQAGSAEHLHRHTHFLGGSSETAFQVPRTGSKVSSFSSLLACRADHSWSIDIHAIAWAHQWSRSCGSRGGPGAHQRSVWTGRSSAERVDRALTAERVEPPHAAAACSIKSPCWSGSHGSGRPTSRRRSTRSSRAVGRAGRAAPWQRRGPPVALVGPEDVVGPVHPTSPPEAHRAGPRARPQPPHV
jgi:hypothetical protein